MKFRKVIALLVLFLFAFSVVSFAGNKNDLAYLNIDELDTESSVSPTDGVIVYDSSTFIPMQGVSVSDIVGAGDGTATLSGYKRDIEVHATTDMTVVLASECGKTFIATQNTKFQLPAAADGLWYTFATGAATELEIQVSTTPDTIVLSFDGSNGNGVIETFGTNTTGNTVTLASDGTNWYAIDQSDAQSWTDGGAWAQLDLGAQ